MQRSDSGSNRQPTGGNQNEFKSDNRKYEAEIANLKQQLIQSNKVNDRLKATITFRDEQLNAQREEILKLKQINAENKRKLGQVKQTHQNMNM